MANKFHYFIPTFFYTVEVAEHKQIKELLLDKIIEAGGTTVWSLCNAKTSFKEPNKLLRNCKLLEDSIWKGYDQLLDEPFILNSYGNKKPSRSSLSIWYNIYEPGDYQEVHNHISNVDYRYSFIYILHDESETGVCFKSSNPNELNYSHASSIHAKNIGIEEGTLIIFPCFVEHYVLPATGSRVTISGNISSI